METGWEPEGFHQPGKKNWYYGNRCTHAHEGGHRGSKDERTGGMVGSEPVSSLIEYDGTPCLPVVYGCLRREPSQSIWDPDREGEKVLVS